MSVLQTQLNTIVGMHCLGWYK